MGLIVLVVGAWTLTATNPIGSPRTAAAFISPVAPQSSNEPVKAFMETPAPVTQIAQTPSERSPINSPALAPADRTTVPGNKTVTIIDGSSGRRQEIMIPATTDLTAAEPLGGTALLVPVPKAAPANFRGRTPPAR
jgi:hypothetical protein